jgi:transposase
VEIQLLSKHGLSLRRIAAEVGCAVNTVRRHLALKAVPKYERKVKRPSKLAPYEASICGSGRRRRSRTGYRRACCTVRSWSAVTRVA